MKVLLDSCVPRPLRSYLTAHEVRTAQEMGWGRLTNGDLLSRADGVFDVLVSADKNLVYQQDLSRRRLAVLVVPTNDWTLLRSIADRVASALDAMRPGEYFEVPSV
jgi:hypothetical protein